jgi:hypothetical protein
MRCPVCKAENGQGPSCRRCKADLGLLFALEGQRARTLGEARDALARGWWRHAHECAARAHALRCDEESARLFAVAALLDGDFYEAWRRYRALAPPQEQMDGAEPVS